MLRHLRNTGAFDDLVELAPVKPDTTTLGTVVYLHSLSLGNQQVDCCTDWTFHCITPFATNNVIESVMLVFTK